MLKQADLVIDLIGLLFSHEQNAILASGTRMLMVLEPLHVLKQLAPSRDLRRRVEYAGDLLTRASKLRVTSGCRHRCHLQPYAISRASPNMATLTPPAGGIIGRRVSF